MQSLHCCKTVGELPLLDLLKTVKAQAVFTIGFSSFLSG
jgi:hypothetical protein